MPITRCSSACAALCSSGPPRQTARRARPPESTSRLAHCWANSSGWRWTKVAMQPTASRIRDVAPARAEERDRLEARLGEQAVADPEGVEGAGGLGLLRQLDEIAGLDRAEHDRPIGQDEPEGCAWHGGLPAAILAAGAGSSRAWARRRADVTAEGCPYRARRRRRRPPAAEAALHEAFCLLSSARRAALRPRATPVDVEEEHSQPRARALRLTRGEASECAMVAASR